MLIGTTWWGEVKQILEEKNIPFRVLNEWDDPSMDGPDGMGALVSVPAYMINVEDITDGLAHVATDYDKAGVDPSLLEQ
jgi:hypothetical protein